MMVDPKEEPIYREAGRMVNRRLVAYSTRYRGANLLPEDLLAMSALDLAATLQRQEVADATGDPTAEFSEMIADLQEFLAQ